MKSSARVCLFRKSREWKDSESWKSRVDVYSQWNMEFIMELMKINTWNGYKGQ